MCEVSNDRQGKSVFSVKIIVIALNAFALYTFNKIIPTIFRKSTNELPRFTIYICIYIYYMVVQYNITGKHLYSQVCMTRTSFRKATCMGTK